MIACLDVDYRADLAAAGCVLAEDWSAAVPSREFTVEIAPVAQYVPGQFYLRELPCLLAALARLAETPDVILIDGYVWLDEANRAGLGAHLHAALKTPVPVVGIAKTEFHGAPAVPVLRGQSRRPLLVTAAGIDVSEAAKHVRSMHGDFRIPSLLRAVDRLCRGGPIPPAAQVQRTGQPRVPFVNPAVGS